VDPPGSMTRRVGTGGCHQFARYWTVTGGKPVYQKLANHVGITPTQRNSPRAIPKRNDWVTERLRDPRDNYAGVSLWVVFVNGPDPFLLIWLLCTFGRNRQISVHSDDTLPTPHVLSSGNITQKIASTQRGFLGHPGNL